MKQYFPTKDESSLVLQPKNYLDDGHEGRLLAVALGQAVENENVLRIIIDFQEVIDIEESVMEVLDRVHEHCQQTGRAFRLINTGQIDKRLEETGRDERLRIRISLSEALRR